MDQSWERAFKYALKVLGVSVIWLVVGLAFILGGVTVISSGIRFGPTALVGGVILLGIGYLVVYVGILVAMFKYLPQAIAEEIKK